MHLFSHMSLAQGDFTMNSQRSEWLVESVDHVCVWV